MTDAQSSGSLLYRIEHLGENNWIPWKTKVQAILGDKGLEGYIDGMKPIPLRGPDPVPADKLAAISKWETEDRKAKTVIVLLVSDTQMVHLMGTNTAKEMWDQSKNHEVSKVSTPGGISCTEPLLPKRKTFLPISSSLSRSRRIST